MPPSHPRPEDLTALSAALSATGDHAAGADDEVLDHMVTVGDHTTQAAVEGVVDHAVDALRELSATCRELTLAIGPHGAPDQSRTTRSTTPAGRDHG